MNMKRFSLAWMICLLLFGGLRAECGKPGDFAKCGVITAGRPKHWTFQDARYLIEGIRHNLGDLKIAQPEDGLDPNAVNLRFLDVLSESLGIGVQFSQLDQVKNRVSLDKYRNDLEKSKLALLELNSKLRRRDEKRDDLIQVKKEEAELKRKLEFFPEEPGEDESAEKEKIEARLVQLAGRRTELEEEISTLDDEIAELKTQSAAPTLAGTSETAPPQTADGKRIGAPQGSLLDQEVVKGALSKRLKQILEDDPKLHYSQVLNNLVEAQLQLISRRLTLLRQSLDPDYELFFLELSASLSPSAKAKHHVARVRWKVEVGERLDKTEVSKLKDGEYGIIGAGAFEPGLETRLSRLADSHRNPFVFEISPAQSALNIARTHARAKNFGFVGIFKFLFGLGVSTEYSRQREQYEQFLGQKVFIAGFGKGEDVFGWDFAPMAGEDLVAPGNYTTYAVLAVPKGVKELKFTPSVGWYKTPSEGGKLVLGQGDLTPQAGPPEVIEIPLHSGFWATALYYSPVDPGREITAILRGVDFSPEIAVFVNNVALDRRTRLSQPEPTPSPGSGGTKNPEDGGKPKNVAANSGESVSGHFEVVSDDTIVMNFKCAPNFTGTPQITLVSPTRSAHLNDLPITVNGAARRVRLKNRPDLVFFKAPPSTPQLAQLDYVGIDPRRQTFSALLTVDGIDLTKPLEVRLEGGAGPVPHEVLEARNQIYIGNLKTSQSYALKIYQMASPFKLMLVHQDIAPFRPVVFRATPLKGPVKGKTPVTITGLNLGEVDAVFFGESPARLLSTPTDSLLLVESPAVDKAGDIAIRIVSRRKWKGENLVAAEQLIFKYQ